MLQLDDEDYEALGWGDTQAQFSNYKWLRASEIRRQQLLQAWRKYQRSEKGRKAAQQYRRSEKGVEAHRRAALSYYYRNRERIRAQQAEYRKAKRGATP